MTEDKERLKRELALILKLDAQLNYSDRSAVEEYYRQLIQKKLLVTSVGQGYIKKLEQILKGEPESRKCLFCSGGTQGDTVICPTCKGKLFGQRKNIQNIQNESSNNNTGNAGIEDNINIQKRKESPQKSNKKKYSLIIIAAIFLIIIKSIFSEDAKSDTANIAQISEADQQSNAEIDSDNVSYNFSYEKINTDELIKQYAACWADMPTDSKIEIEKMSTLKKGNYLSTEYIIQENGIDVANIILEHDENYYVEGIILILNSYESSEIFYNMIHVLNHALSPKEALDLLTEIMTVSDEHMGESSKAITTEYDSLFYAVTEADLYDLEDGLVLFISTDEAYENNDDIQSADLVQNSVNTFLEQYENMMISQANKISIEEFTVDFQPSGENTYEVCLLDIVCGSIQFECDGGNIIKIAEFANRNDSIGAFLLITLVQTIHPDLSAEDAEAVIANSESEHNGSYDAYLYGNYTYRYYNNANSGTLMLMITAKDYFEEIK